MRFRGRTASDKPLATTADDVLQLGDTGELPMKAQALLGTRSKSQWRTAAKQADEGRAVERASPQGPKNPGKRLPAHEASQETQQSLLDNMPQNERRGPRLQMWPNTEQHNRSANHLLKAEVYLPNRRPAVPSRKTSSNGVQEYYDPSREPLYVSQQTSASAARDMGLRKGARPPMVHESASEPHLTYRPLKSAMKKGADTRQPSGMFRRRTDSNDGHAEKKAKRLDLSQFFPQHKPSQGQLLSPDKLSRSPSNLSDNSSFFPPETVQVQLKRPATNEPFRTQPSLSPPSHDSVATARPKVFEPDVYDSAKTHVRRPPKGITNWFDGFDISSDEDEREAAKASEPQMEPVELPANEALPSTFSPWAEKVEIEQDEKSKRQHRGKRQPNGKYDMKPRYEATEYESLQRGATARHRDANHQSQHHDGQSIRDTWGLRPESDQPLVHRKESVDPVEDNLLAIEAAKERMQERMRNVQQRKRSVDSGTIGSGVSSQKPPSRFARSRLASESVLSLSDSEGEDKAGQLSVRDSVDDGSIKVRNASSIYVEKPSQTPKKVQTKRVMPRESTSTVVTNATGYTNQTSGSIPIRLTNSIPLPEDGLWSPMQRRETRPNTEDGRHHAADDGTAHALRLLEGQRDSKSEPARSRPTTKASTQDFESSVTAESSNSSLPSDASHMMAVTEEEMILLEMMRNKRAMMQKSSYSEGYQSAVKREQEQLDKRRESARQAAMKFLRQRDARNGTPPAKANRNSRMAERVDRVVEGTDPLPELDDEIRRKYSAIRKEDVNQALKLEKFLASAETPTAESFPEPPTVISPGGEKGPHQPPPQKFELLLPKAYSPAASHAESHESSPVLGEEDIETHHHRIREFLAASTAAEEAGPKSAFPAPPLAAKNKGGRREKRRSFMSVSPVVEEEPIIPDIPERNPSRAPPSPNPLEVQDRRSSISGRRLSCHTLENDPLLETASAHPAPLRQAASDNGSDHSRQKHPQQHTQQQKEQSSPFFLSPNLDFAPLDFNSNHSIDSPSISTSHASPLTPTFTAPPSTTDKQATEGATSGNSDAERSNPSSFRGRAGRAWTPDTVSDTMTTTTTSTSLQAPTPAKKPHAFTAAAGKKAAAAPKLVHVPPHGLNTRGSIASITSAGEDVLAAWAELGGGTEGLASRRRVR